MQQETIEIRTTKEKFFQEYLILKKPIIDSILTKLNGGIKTSLSEFPMKVLAQLLFYNDANSGILNEDDRWKVVFSKETKELICDSLGMKEHHLNVYISQLRKLKILNGKTIRKHFVVYSSDQHSLNFKFELNGHS